MSERAHTGWSVTPPIRFREERVGAGVLELTLKDIVKPTRAVRGWYTLGAPAGVETW